MFDFMDVMFVGIALISLFMCLAPFFITGALIYFGFIKKKKDPVKQPEAMHTTQMHTTHDRVFRYDPSYMKVGKTELTFRIVQYTMMAVLMIIMPITLFFGFKAGTDLSNGIPVPVIVGMGATAVFGIVFGVTGYIANLMKKARMADYIGDRIFH